MRTPEARREALAKFCMDQAQKPSHEEGTGSEEAERKRQAYLEELATLVDDVSSDFNKIVQKYHATGEESPAIDDRHPHKHCQAVNTHITEADYR